MELVEGRALNSDVIVVTDWLARGACELKTQIIQVSSLCSRRLSRGTDINLKHIITWLVRGKSVRFQTHSHANWTNKVKNKIKAMLTISLSAAKIHPQFYYSLILFLAIFIIQLKFQSNLNFPQTKTKLTAKSQTLLE